DDVLATVAGEGADLAAIQQQLPNLMIAGYRDQQLLVVDRQGPGAAERRGRWSPGPVPPRHLGRTPIPTRKSIERRSRLAGPCERRDDLLCQIDLADQVILGIGDVE